MCWLSRWWRVPIVALLTYQVWLGGCATNFQRPFLVFRGCWLYMHHSWERCQLLASFLGQVPAPSVIHERDANSWHRLWVMREMPIPGIVHERGYGISSTSYWCCLFVLIFFFFFSLFFFVSMYVCVVWWGGAGEHYWFIWQGDQFLARGAKVQCRVESWISSGRYSTNPICGWQLQRQFLWTDCVGVGWHSVWVSALLA